MKSDKTVGTLSFQPDCSLVQYVVFCVGAATDYQLPFLFIQRFSFAKLSQTPALTGLNCQAQPKPNSIWAELAVFSISPAT